jgi:excisionase family DNA binding protein
MTTQRLAVDVVEAGKMLGLGRSAAYAAAARGEIPTLKFGRKIIVPLVQLEALLRGDA